MVEQGASVHRYGKAGQDSRRGQGADAFGKGRRKIEPPASGDAQTLGSQGTGFRKAAGLYQSEDALFRAQALPVQTCILWQRCIEQFEQSHGMGETCLPEGSTSGFRQTLRPAYEGKGP